MLIDIHLAVPSQADQQYLSRLLQTCARFGLDGACVIGENSIPAMDLVRAAVPSEDFCVFFGAKFQVGRGYLLLIPADPGPFNEAASKVALSGWDDAMELAKVTDAVVVAVHPYDRTPGTTFSDGIFQLEGLDAVEVANATRSETANRMALDAALRLHLAPVAGTGHRTSPATVGRAATAFPRLVKEQASFVETIRRGEVFAVEMISQRARQQRGRRPQSSAQAKGEQK